MNRRLFTVIAIAVMIAGACAYVVFRLASARLGAAKSVPTASVIAATGDIKIGTLLAPSHLRTIQISGALPKGAILKAENAIGRGVISNLYEGEPIIEDRLAAPGSGGGLAATIPDGMRACAVKVDDVVGVAGFATPGMRVDVLVSGTPPSASSSVQTVVTKTILQNIEVLSAGTDIQKDAEGKPKQVQVVNLLVTPKQAETLSLASTHLTIQLVLRNPLDTKIAEVESTAMSSLFLDRVGTPAKPAAPRIVHQEKPGDFAIEVVTGSKRTELKVGATEGQK